MHPNANANGRTYCSKRQLLNKPLGEFINIGFNIPPQFNYILPRGSHSLDDIRVIRRSAGKDLSQRPGTGFWGNNGGPGK
jgi:hypothetical protein